MTESFDGTETTAKDNSEIEEKEITVEVRPVRVERVAVIKINKDGSAERLEDRVTIERPIGHQGDGSFVD